MKPFLLPGDIVMLTGVNVPVWLCISSVIVPYASSFPSAEDSQVNSIVLMHMSSLGIHQGAYDNTFCGFDLIMRDGQIIDNRTSEQRADDEW